MHCHNWPKTTGVISSVSYRSTRGGKQQPRHIVYQYNVLGKQFTSDRISNKYIPSPFETEKDVVQLRPGQHVNVFFNPKNPSESSLLIGSIQQPLRVVRYKREPVNYEQTVHYPDAM